MFKNKTLSFEEKENWYKKLHELEYKILKLQETNQIKDETLESYARDVRKLENDLSTFKNLKI
jgi:gas vesicle protein